MKRFTSSAVGTELDAPGRETVIAAAADAYFAAFFISSPSRYFTIRAAVYVSPAAEAAPSPRFEVLEDDEDLPF